MVNKQAIMSLIHDEFNDQVLTGIRFDEMVVVSKV